MRSARLYLCLWASVLGVGCMTPDLELARSLRGVTPEEKFLERHHYQLDEVLKALKVKRSWFKMERTESGDEWRLDYFHKHCTYQFTVNDAGKVTWAYIKHEPLPGPSLLDRLLGISATTFVKSDADMKRIVNEEAKSLDRVLKRLRLQRRDLAIQPGSLEGRPDYEHATSKGLFIFVVEEPDEGDYTIIYASFLTPTEVEERARRSGSSRR